MHGCAMGGYKPHLTCLNVCAMCTLGGAISLFKHCVMLPIVQYVQAFWAIKNQCQTFLLKGNKLIMRNKPKQKNTMIVYIVTTVFGYCPRLEKKSKG